MKRSDSTAFHKFYDYSVISTERSEWRHVAKRRARNGNLSKQLQSFCLIVAPFTKSCTIIVLSVLTVVAAALLIGCRRVSDSQIEQFKVTSDNDLQPGRAGGLPPLVVDADAPLLLAGPPDIENLSTSATTRAAGQNAACFVCHANYQDEALVAWHAAADVGCAECHGKSYPHCNDENHRTPPDKMVPPDEIRAFCDKCHPAHDVPAEKLSERRIQRGLNVNNDQALVCTDCHGDHRLTRRSVRWDKKNGRLIRPDAGG